MRWIVPLLWLSVCLAQPLVKESGFQAAAGGLPAGWRVWAPRPDIAPKAVVDPVRFRQKPGSLLLVGNSNPAVCGGWERLVSGIEEGKWYRLTAHYLAEGPLYEPVQALARLDWALADGKRAGQPDYAYATTQAGAWKRVRLEAPAPAKASAVKLQLLMLNAPGASLWWDEIWLEAIPAPAPRRVTIASLNQRPTGKAPVADNIGFFIESIEKAVPAGADLILLGEGVTMVGTGKKYADVAETVPGPSTERLGELARRRKAYIAAGIYEREGPAIYNTSVLLDREGRVAGKYRKVYLPREEMEGGLTPGSDYPIFQTDFGRVGMMICWDLQYADPARALALRGAEIILLPIWGGNLTLGKARAIENQVFLVAAGYSFPTYIVDPNGEVLAQADKLGTAAVATIDLTRRYVDNWLGWMRGRFMKELRLDVPVDPRLALR